ncbi:MAG TPA: hypothetical protein VK457_11035 [Chloroflexota bacterium]|jgi:enoyl-CoA hydratase/carnithine racemase|nr:hypothetical protein [Chloroflexota bacterium]
MAHKKLLVETVDGGVGIITFNRPEVLNGLSTALMAGSLFSA